MAHNKTLAAQLYQEFRRFFPENAVEYFVSYYDYYQPEAYVPATDSYIEKEATINDEIDRMRLSATRSLFERRDVIIVASVSCIYGLGSPEAYYGMLLPLQLGPAHRSGPDPPIARRDPVRAERHRVWSRHVSRQGRHRRGRTVVRGARAADRTLRGRGGRAGLVRRAHGRRDPPARQSGDLSEVALRGVARTDEAGGRVDQGGAGGAPDTARVAGKASGGTATAPAHDVRPGDDSRDRLLPRDRELRQASHRPGCPASLRQRSSTICPRMRS